MLVAGKSKQCLQVYVYHIQHRINHAIAIIVTVVIDMNKSIEIETLVKCLKKERKKEKT